MIIEEHLEIDRITLVPDLQPTIRQKRRIKPRRKNGSVYEFRCKRFDVSSNILFFGEISNEPRSENRFGM